MSTITAAYEAIKSVKAIIATVSSLNTDTKVVGELNHAAHQVSDALDALLQAKEKMFEQQDQIRKLKDEIETFNTWAERFSKYDLISTKGGAVVYRSREEPIHYLCPSCAERRELQILQGNTTVPWSFACPSCRVKYPIEPARRPRIQSPIKNW